MRHAETTGGSNRAARTFWIATIITVLHAPSFTKPLLDPDEAIYASIAGLLNAGGRLYAEGGVDNKFPGIFWTYAVVFRIFGRYAMGAVHLTALLVVLCTAWVLSRIARRIGGERSGWLAALLYGVLTTFYYPKMLAANTELFTMLPLSVSVLLSMPGGTARPRTTVSLFTAGALIGAATLFRQLSALNLVLSAGAPLLANSTKCASGLWRAILPLTGFAVMLAALVAAFALQGNLNDLWFWTVQVVTTRYLPVSWRHEWPGLRHLGMLGALMVPAILVFMRARGLRGRSIAERFIWLWLALSIASILVVWQFHGHYVIVALGPLAILSALELDRQSTKVTGPARRRLVAWCTVLLAVPAAAFAAAALVTEPIVGGLEPPQPDYPEIARYIRESTSEGQRVFVWGAFAPIYVLSNRLPASRFVAFMRGCLLEPAMRLRDCWDSGRETWPLLERDLLENRAELIVDTAPADYRHFGAYTLRSVPTLEHILSTHYHLERTIGRVDIYRRDASWHSDSK